MIYYTFESIKYSPYTAVIATPNNKPHKLQFWKITYTINGEAEVLLNGKNFTLSGSTLLFVKPGDVLQNRKYSDGYSYRHRDIYVSDELLRNICSTLPLNPYEDLINNTPFIKVSPLQTANLELVLNAFPVNSEEMNEQLDTFHRTVIINCLTLFIQSICTTNNPPRWLVELADKVCLPEYLQNDVSYFLKNVPYSKRHVTRYFKQYYGVTPSEHLTKAKVVQASNYLMDKDLRIIDITQMVGFDTQSGFIKAFKAYFNLSPNEWRKQYLNDVTMQSTSKFGPEDSTN